MRLEQFAGVAYGYFVDGWSLKLASLAWPRFKTAAIALDMIRARRETGVLVVSSTHASTVNLPIEVFSLIRDELWWTTVTDAARQPGLVPSHDCTGCRCRGCAAAFQRPCWPADATGRTLLSLDLTSICWSAMDGLLSASKATVRDTAPAMLNLQASACQQFVEEHLLHSSPLTTCEDLDDGMGGNSSWITSRLISGIAYQQEASNRAKYDGSQPRHAQPSERSKQFRAVCSTAYDWPSVPPCPMVIDSSCFDVQDTITRRLRRFVQTYGLPLSSTSHQLIGGSTKETSSSGDDSGTLPDPQFILWAKPVDEKCVVAS